MSGKNGQIHIFLKTEFLDRLDSEAKELEISRSELVRRKLSFPILDEEKHIITRVIQIIKKEIKDGKEQTQGFN